MESQHDRDTRLRKHLPFRLDGTGATSIEVVKHLLHAGKGGESRHAEGLVSARILDKIAEDAKNSGAKPTGDPWGVTLRK